MNVEQDVRPQVELEAEPGAEPETAVKAEAGPGGPAKAERPLGSRAPRFVRERRALHLSWQAGVFLVGLAVVVAGVVMLVVPGPGWLTIFAGMAIWATEFVWAQLVMRWTRKKLHEGREWLKRRRAARAARKRS